MSSKEVPRVSEGELATPPTNQSSTSGDRSLHFATSDSSCDEHVKRIHSGGTDGAYAPDAQGRRISVWESLGISGCIAIVGGSAVVLAIVAFLIFLWAGIGPLPGGEQALPGWRRIMLDGWATRSVTISSLVLRAATAFQTGVCASLIAALFIERGEVPISQSAYLSLSRGLSSSPAAFLGRLTFSRSRITTKGVRLEWIVLIILAGTSIALQFSSTILLSCFGMTSLVRLPVSLKVNTGTSDERAAMIQQTITGDSGSLDYGGPADRDFAVFGLHPSDATTTQGSGLSDTGLKRHAFLPFNQGNRSSILSYEGPSLVANTRVSCLRPNVSAVFGIPEVGDFPTYAIYGNISYEETFKAAGQPPPTVCSDGKTSGCFPPGFVCAFVLANPGLSNPSPQAFACLLQPNSTAGDDWEVGQNPLVAESRSWPILVFSTNMIDDDISDDRTIRYPLNATAPYDEWSGYETVPGGFMNMSLCFIGYSMKMSHVSMKRQKDSFEEPTVATTVLGNDTGVSEVESMFVEPASGLADDDSASLSIDDIRESGLEPKSVATTLDLLNDLGVQALFAQAVNNEASIFLCVYCTGLGIGVPTDLQRLFNNMINSRASASLALEVLFTIYTQRVYYFAQSGFDLTTRADAVFSAGYEIPNEWIGLKAVLILIFLQLFSVWLIALQYVHKVRFSRQGNIWHTVSQLVSPDSAPILSQSHEVKDRQVSRILKQRDPSVSVARSPATGVIGLSILRDTGAAGKSRTQ
ncbi:hypothetical protein GGR57DRAFT_513227 [Xylariaceae sp. FL1272]|nr:hypothetical protein GGR57DRAFT_513227 [Xylariaceae sp. FL1272]